MKLILSDHPSLLGSFEVVERKGIGHPDTICDALVEHYSRSLCAAYIERFGRVLHYNVDKALLCGGCASPKFGGGQINAPLEIYLGGRVCTGIGDNLIPVETIAIEKSHEWLKANLRHLDSRKHVRINPKFGTGSTDLIHLFDAAGEKAVPLANDTSIGVGHAPLSRLEQLVPSIEATIRRLAESAHPEWGEDIKIMAIRTGDELKITLSCAMVDQHLADALAYLESTRSLRAVVAAVAQGAGFYVTEVTVNAADDVAMRRFFLTTSGTSAEAGDDGQVGRGNRMNGLITPLRPMSLEAHAGKNPISHVGKIYNALAPEIAASVVSSRLGVVACRCILVSQIGHPIDAPACIEIGLETVDESLAEQHREAIEDIVNDHLSRIRSLSDRLMYAASSL